MNANMSEAPLNEYCFRRSSTTIHERKKPFSLVLVYLKMLPGYRLCNLLYTHSIPVDTSETSNCFSYNSDLEYLAADSQSRVRAAGSVP